MGARSNFFTAKLVDGEYDRKYASAALNARFASYFSTGIHVTESGILGNQLQVTPAGGMNVQINIGIAEGMEGHQMEIYGEPYIVTLPVADGVYNRYDNVILECNLSDDVRDFFPGYTAGIPSENPAAPGVTRNNVVFQMALARVRIRAGATEITEEDITDTRSDDDLCGISNVRLGIKMPVGGGNVLGPEISTAGRMAVFADGAGNVIREATDDEDNGWRPVYDLEYDGEAVVYYVPGDQRQAYKRNMYLRFKKNDGTIPAGGDNNTGMGYGLIKGAIYDGANDRTNIIINCVAQADGEEPYIGIVSDFSGFDAAWVSPRGMMPVDIPDVEFTYEYYAWMYTVQLRDDGSHIKMNRETEQNLGVPSDDLVPHRVGAQILIEQIGEGPTIPYADGDIELICLNGHSTAGPGSLAMLVKTGPNRWVFFGQTE